MAETRADPPARETEAGQARPEAALAAANEALVAGDLDRAVAQLSAAIRGFTADRRPCDAAMACIRLGDAFANMLGNRTAARAWFTRARRMLEDHEPCVEQGWVAVAAMGCDVDDPAELLAGAELALDRARRFADVNLETKALADGGLAHVQAGRVDSGMAMLDEAMALCCGPADDMEAAGKSVCSFFTACYYAADFARASSWTDLLRKRGLISTTSVHGLFLSGHCDSVQATLLVELGRWSEADALLERGRQRWSQRLPTPAWHLDIALADLRIRQGRLAEAEALLMGKDHAMQALVPMARLHVARGDHALARAVATRGLRGLRDDRLRAVELLTILVDAALAAGDTDAATAACGELTKRAADLDVPVLAGRAASARARALSAAGDVADAAVVLEDVLDRVEANELPLLRATLLQQLAGLRKATGDAAGAALDSDAAAALLADLDVVTPTPTAERQAVASMQRDGNWWTFVHGHTSVRLADTKGFRYLAMLLERPGIERHALDLVDGVEGVGDVDRRTLGDAGALVDAKARAAYRRRVEQLRADIEDALGAGMLESAEALQAELDTLVAQLAAAFGLGGRDRKAASAAEKARLNVTRALRSAIARVVDALPEGGAVLDRRVRTGMYCAYGPEDDDPVRWIVQS
jgi:tetratricopeptide (TPR) repeat protein